MVEVPIPNTRPITNQQDTLFPTKFGTDFQYLLGMHVLVHFQGLDQ